MRKISQLAANAFIHGKEFNRDNTRVVQTELSSRLYLHGHLIAERIYSLHGISMVAVSLAGWGTPTTRERVNGLLETLGCPTKFYQKNHCQMLGDVEVDSSEWQTVGTRC
jgi:hypothetical protein